MDRLSLSRRFGVESIVEEVIRKGLSGPTTERKLVDTGGHEGRPYCVTYRVTLADKGGGGRGGLILVELRSLIYD